MVGPCLEQGIDYVGNDLNALSTGENYARGSGRRDSTAECQGLCQTTPGCMVFTYKTDSKHCFLKTSKSGKIKRPSSISGKKYCGTEGIL